MRNIGKLLFIFILLGTVAFVGSNISAKENVRTASYRTEKPSSPIIEVSEAPFYEGHALRVKSVLLTASNTLVFRTPFEATTCARAQQALLRMDVSLPKGEPIYLVLNTPGGDVEAGNQLIDTANGLSRPVHTITIFAASMGFNTVQALGNRYILPSGTLMAHRVRVGGIGGQVPGEFLTAVTRVIRQTQRMEMRNASRMGISFADYTKLINAEYWVDGEDAVRQGVADAVVNIRCDASLEGTSEETLQTPFGPISLIWSDCPAVTNPIGFKYSGPSPQDAVKSYLSNRQAKGIYGQ